MRTARAYVELGHNQRAKSLHVQHAAARSLDNLTGGLTPLGDGIRFAGYENTRPDGTPARCAVYEADYPD